TGSNIPSSRGRAAGGAVINRYSGKMVRGKFDGPVVNVDASGKTFHGTFVNGTKANDWVAGPLPRTDQQLSERVSKSASPEPAPPAAGPSHVAVTALAPLRPTSTPSLLQSNPGEIEPAVKSRMITDFKE